MPMRPRLRLLRSLETKDGAMAQYDVKEQCHSLFLVAALAWESLELLLSLLLSLPCRGRHGVLCGENEVRFWGGWRKGVSWEVSAGVVSGDRLDHLGSRTRRLDQWQRSARDKSRWA
jgi:hypothetical protein